MSLSRHQPRLLQVAAVLQLRRNFVSHRHARSGQPGRTGENDAGLRRVRDRGFAIHCRHATVQWIRQQMAALSERDLWQSQDAALSLLRCDCNLHWHGHAGIIRQVSRNRVPGHVAGPICEPAERLSVFDGMCRVLAGCGLLAPWIGSRRGRGAVAECAAPRGGSRGLDLDRGRTDGAPVGRNLSAMERKNISGRDAGDRALWTGPLRWDCLLDA